MAMKLTKDEQELKDRLEPVLMKIVNDANACESELEIAPYTKLKPGILKKDATSENDYQNAGFAGKCYKDTWFRLNTTYKKVYKFQIKASDYKLRKQLISTLQRRYDIKVVQQYFIEIEMDKNNDLLIDLINDIKKEMTESYIWLCENETVPLVYGCCSKYMECSNAKKCIQESIDVKYAKGCDYRKNLKAGHIFYGKNKNN